MTSYKELPPAGKQERTSLEMQELLFPRPRAAAMEKRFMEEIIRTAWKPNDRT